MLPGGEEPYSPHVQTASKHVEVQVVLRFCEKTAMTPMGFDRECCYSVAFTCPAHSGLPFLPSTRPAIKLL